MPLKSGGFARLNDIEKMPVIGLPPFCGPEHIVGMRNGLKYFLRLLLLAPFLITVRMPARSHFQIRTAHVSIVGGQINTENVIARSSSCAFHIPLYSGDGERRESVMPPRRRYGLLFFVTFVFVLNFQVGEIGFDNIIL